MTDIYSYNSRHEEQTMIKTDSGKRKKEQFIENLKEGDTVNDLFAIKNKNPPRPYKRGTWFSFVAVDQTGEISVKYWGGENKDRVKRLFESFKTGDVIQIRTGSVEVYEDILQISINEKSGGLRRCSPDEFDYSDFIPSLDEKKIKVYHEELKSEINSIENEQLKNLLKMFFDNPEFTNDYIHTPSAMTHHHNYIGGNLEHTLGVVRLCKNICDMYPVIDRDLVVTGAILHDIGKIKEYKISATIDKTDEGNFIGHIVIGDRWIREKIEELRKKGNTFDDTLGNYLCHMLLSHHGKYEYGSPRMPKIIEACVLHQADLMDSQVKNFIQNIEEIKKNSNENWTFVYDSDLGRKRVMYSGEL